jgi:mono/diheme cytochrome c family protein
VLRPTLFAAAYTVSLLATPALAQSAPDILAGLQREAQRSQAGFEGFSAQRGQQFFRSTHGGEWSCASCHTENPAAAGRHARTGKVIQPLAPAANPARFTDPAKVDKWFKRNCNDVLSRPCTAQEKGDVLTWLLQIK